MEVVAATKMRKSQEFAIRARPYAIASLELMQNLLARTPQLPILLQPREVTRSVVLVVTSDKGLAGAFNANVIKKADQLLSQKKAAGLPLSVIAVGKKAKNYAERKDLFIEETFWGFGDFSQVRETMPVADLLINGFIAGTWDEVEAVYTNFRTTILQEATVKKILPATAESLTEAVKEILPEKGKFASPDPKPYTRNPIPYNYEYKFEPSADEILSVLLPQLIRMHIHHIILESNASEHSARMVAMKNASDNARDLISDLTLQANNIRQAGITRELIEITAGREALES